MAEKTVFNYSPTKEDLFYSRLEPFEDELPGAIRERARQVFARYEESLAALLAEETRAAPDDVEPWAVANVLLGTHRSLIDYVRRRTLAGAGAGEIARGVPAQATRALALLERGLGDYAVKRP